MNRKRILCKLFLGYMTLSCSKTTDWREMKNSIEFSKNETANTEQEPKNEYFCVEYHVNNYTTTRNGGSSITLIPLFKKALFSYECVISRANIIDWLIANIFQNETVMKSTKRGKAYEPENRTEIIQKHLHVCDSIESFKKNGDTFAICMAEISGLKIIGYISVKKDKQGDRNLFILIHEKYARGGAGSLAAQLAIRYLKQLIHNKEIENNLKIYAHPKKGESGEGVRNFLNSLGFVLQNDNSSSSRDKFELSISI